MKKETDESEESENNLIYIVNYLLLWITGILIYLTKASNNKRLKLHAVQAISLGVLSAIISIILNILSLPTVSVVASTVIWLLGLYVGFMAYSGKDVRIPLISNYAESHSGYDLESKTKKKNKSDNDNENSVKSDDAIEMLKLRFAKGEITKEKYKEMKEALEG